MFRHKTAEPEPTPPTEEEIKQDHEECLLYCFTRLDAVYIVVRNVATHHEGQTRVKKGYITAFSRAWVEVSTDEDYYKRAHAQVYLTPQDALAALRRGA
jgi:hypothetical protein